MSIMFTRLTVRHFAVAIVLTLAIVTVVSAQTNTPPSAPSGPMEELLAEVRSLRAEVRRAADTSIRAQLLVARLQLQEQRINSLTRQLVETQRQLSDNERARGAMAAPLAMFTRDENQQSAEDREGFDVVLGPLKAQLQQLERSDRDLQSQQTQLTNLIAEEQSRWTMFNAMLDELSKPVEARPLR
jgi:chromosome segregation ATPase